MPKPDADIIKWALGVFTAVIGVANTVILSLCIWIVNGLRKKDSENSEDIRRAHQRIDTIEKERKKDWTDKEKDCGQEKAERAKLEERVNHIGNSRNENSSRAI